MKNEVWQKYISIIVVAICIIAVVTIIILDSRKDDSLSPQAVYAYALSSVVELKASSESVGESYGSGVFVSSDGKLVTNAHVVTYKQMGIAHTFESYEIRFANETDFHAVELIQYDEQSDLALLRLKENCTFTPVGFGSFEKLRSGSTVYAVGNALNHGISITQGIISVPLIQIENDNKVRAAIQCDLTISEGNSGGALFDEKGKLVGITTFRTRDDKGNVVYGVAYCIPVNIVSDYIETNAA